MTKRKHRRGGFGSSATKRQVLRQEEINVTREAVFVVQSAGRGEGRLVTLGSLLFFSTAGGDAWVLDPEDNLALQLAEQGVPLPYRIMETPDSFAVEWHADYAITGSDFVVQRRDGRVSVFPSYPVELIREGERWARGQGGSL
jgi:hypothetical protein